jgi:hypothetical protein
MLLMIALVPVAFELAPVTRRRYKVQRRHFVRIVLYQLPVLCMVLQIKMFVASGAGLVMQILDQLGLPWAYDIERFLTSATAGWEAYGFGLALLLSLWWWYAACKWYLKLPRPAVIAAGLTILAALSAFAICWAIPGMGGNMMEQIGAY